MRINKGSTVKKTVNGTGLTAAVRMIILLIYCMAASAIMSSCSMYQCNDKEKTLTDCTWIIIDDKGARHGELTFTDEKMHLRAEMSGGDYLIDQPCIITEDSIILNSEEMGINEIGYNIFGNNLELVYGGKKIGFVKENVTSEESSRED